MTLRSRLVPMTGRNPDRDGRVGSNLELFYDLVFVVAFSAASTQLAHYVADGHYRTAIIGYLLTTFAAIWAWINFAWFASAFDTDDWLFRLSVLVQMVGVAVIAIGLPAVFTSIEAQQHPEIKVLVVGYIVMRVGMVGQWLRAAIQAPEYRRTALTYAVSSLIAQVGWVIVAFIPTGLRATLVAAAVCVVIEMLGPWYAETRVGPTPWNASHIAERYGTLTMVTLGEGVVGTVAVVGALIGRTAWSGHTIALGLAAMGLTFAMWWLYFLMPNGETLSEYRSRAFKFGYGSIPLFMACAAVGAGLHVVALQIEGEAHISHLAITSALAIPVGVFCLGVIGMNAYLMHGGKPVRWQIPAVVATLVPLIAGPALAYAGAPLLVAVLVTCLTPVLPVLVIETTDD